MSKEKFISLKFDFSWKDIFRNEIIRKYFIADVLDIPVEKIHSVRLMNTFLWRRYRWQKQGILDVLVEFNDNTKINIELQISTYAYWDRRSLFYLAKMYTEDLRIGQNYAKLKNCINISVLDFDFTKNPQYHTVYRLRDQKGNEFSDVFEIHIIELCKELTEGVKINDWIRLINAKSKEDLDMIQTKNPGILEAIKELNIMNLSKRMHMRYEAQMKIIRDKNAREDYVREEGRLIGQEEGRLVGQEEGRLVGQEEGKKEGILIEQKKVIQKMRAKGHSDEDIAGILETTPEHLVEIMADNRHTN